MADYFQRRTGTGDSGTVPHLCKQPRSCSLYALAPIHHCTKALTLLGKIFGHFYPPTRSFPKPFPVPGPEGCHREGEADNRFVPALRQPYAHNLARLYHTLSPQNSNQTFDMTTAASPHASRHMHLMQWSSGSLATLLSCGDWVKLRLLPLSGWYLIGICL